MSNFSVISDDEANELRKFREFYKEVSALTAKHDSLEYGNMNVAVVYPSKLGSSLSKVNPEWYTSNRV